MINLKGTIKYSLIAILLNSTQARVYDIATSGDDFSTYQGTIVQYDDQTKQSSLLYTFQNNNNDGINPTKLVQDDLGNVVGITYSGGAFKCIDQETGETIGCGTLFSISNGVYTQLHQFGGAADGDNPISLVKGSHFSVDMLYGVTPYGGANNCGTLFSVDLFGNYSKVYDFACTNGTPKGALVNADDGYLYGTTSNSPSLYRFDPSTNNVTFLSNFPPLPAGDLQNINGTLYGISGNGGANDTGFIYSISTTGDNFKVVYNFGKPSTADIGWPTIITSDEVDNIYGVARQYPGTASLGVIYQYTISTNSIKIIYKSNNNSYGLGSLKYDFLNNALLGSTYAPVNFFLSPVTNFNFNNVLPTLDPKYGVGVNDVIALT